MVYYWECFNFLVFCLNFVRLNIHCWTAFCVKWFTKDEFNFSWIKFLPRSGFSRLFQGRVAWILKPKACWRRVCSASGELWEGENGNIFGKKFKMLLHLFSPSRRPVRPLFFKKLVNLIIPRYATASNWARGGQCMLKGREWLGRDNERCVRRKFTPTQTWAYCAQVRVF